MIDFIKVELNSHTAKMLEAHPLLEFSGEFSRKNGDVRPFPRKASYKGLTIEIKSENYCELSGSLHKFACGGVNYTDFSFLRVVNAIRRLMRELGLQPEQARLRNIEIGINLTGLPIAPNRFIRSVLAHKGKAFSEMRNVHRQPIGIECYHQRYGIKIYNKGKQYRSLPYPVLRFEIKYTKMHDLAKHSIVNLSDLSNPDVWPVFVDQITRRFDELLISDPTLRPESLKPAQRHKLAHYENPKHWEGLKEQSRKMYDYHRRQYRQWIERYAADPVQAAIAEKCQEKMSLLLPNDGKSLAKLTDLQNQNLSHINPSYKGLPMPY